MVLLNPEELHDGRAADAAGYAYRSVYPAASLLGAVAAEITDGRHDGADMAGFTAPIVDDAALFARLRHLHARVEAAAPALEVESLLARAFGRALRHHAGRIARVRPVGGSEPRAVRRVLAQLHDDPAHPHRLDELAAVAGLSRFYLLRVFKQALGETPHGYLTNLRVRRARHLLERGVPPAAVAAACGFADQAHLTRAFRTVVGLPPGRYQRALRGAQGG